MVDGNALDEYLKKRGITKTWLAKEAGISENTLWRICREKNAGHLDTWLRISEALGCTIEEILERD